jgi:hypothetical protein
MPRSLAATAVTVSAASFAVALLVDVPSARAETPADHDAAILEAAGHMIKSTVVQTGSGARIGHAEILINATGAKVLSVVTDYAHYKDIVPNKLHNVHVVAKDQTGTDVRFEVPIMHGAVKIIYKLRFGPPVTLATGEKVVEGKYLDGNVQTADLLFTIHQVAPAFTVLKIDNLIGLKVPAPQAMIDEELRDAAGDAAEGMRARAQGGNGDQVAYDSTLKPAKR